MADNTVLNPGSGGDITRTVDKNGVKTPTVILDLGGGGAESLLTGTLPVSVSGTVTVNGSGVTQPVSAASLPLPTNAAAETGGNLASLVAKDFATQTTLAALNTKVTACNTGAVVISSGSVTASVTGSVTANAGTNLNTSALALEAGNLATLTSKDFATQTTLALIKAKTDNLDVTLSGGGTHVIVDSMPAAASAATATEDAPEYAEAESAAFSQDLDGNLRTRVSAVVSESQPVYIDGQVRPLSLNSDGRLRVSVVPAPDYIEFFVPFDFGYPTDIRELSTSPWSALS